jgi:hypothetical protein
MKTLKQLREEYDADFLTQILPEELMLEEKKSYTSAPTPPSPNKMPAMLLFRRVSYRLFPGRNFVALYYSKSLDKYLSIPFGPEGNLNLSEATIYNTLEDIELKEDWQSVNRKDKTDGLSQKAVNAYRRENPGSKLQTAVTEKNPKGKRASRRKSFCSRMGGMKKRLTSAKTANDPDSNINKALRRWNCEEDFKMKLYELRMQRNEGVADVLDAGAEAIVPYYSAGKKLYKGDYKGAATDAAIDTAMLATGAVAGKALAGGARLASKGLGRLASRFGRGASKAKPTPKPTKTPTKAPKSKVPVKPGMPDININLGGGKSGGPDMSDNPKIQFRPVDIKTKSSWEQRSSGDPIYKSRMKTQSLTPVKENKMSDLRQMIDEGRDTMDIGINGRSVTLNTGMAKRILEVYDSVNSKNKKIVENMLNEDLESFKRLLTFSIRN